MVLHDIMASQVARICNSNDVTLASCFPVSREVIVTCYHAFQDINDSGNVEYRIYWPRLSLVRTAKFILNEINLKDDIAFLMLNEPLPDKIEFVPIGLHHSNEGNFISFGYRKVKHYDGLFASGKLLGEICATDGRQLIQLQTNEIEEGMSGAPILDQAYGTIIGMVSEYWATETSTDTSLAFATPVSRLIAVKPSIAATIPELIAAPKNIDSGLFQKERTSYRLDHSINSSDFVRACMRLLLLVLADQLPDGAWGRTLWKETDIKYTTDVADKAQIKATHIKKALSATSWAAQALAKTVGNTSLYPIKQATQFALKHRDGSTGAFGNIYAIHSGTPLVNRTTFIRSPRHTASGIKLLELSQGLNHDIIKGFEFIIRNECARGGWGEAIGDEPNVLSTTYVLDTLIKLMQIPELKKLLSPSVALAARPATTRGLTWLIEQRDKDGLWQYADNSEYKPLYSAHVLGFTPQLVSSFYDEIIESLNTLISLTNNGGIPATWGGKPDFTTTALCLYALLRIDPDKYSLQIDGFVSWLIAQVCSDEWLLEYSCLEGIFGLVSLTQLPNMPRNELTPIVNPIFENPLLSKYALLDKPDYWLEVDRRYQLGITTTIERMYL